MSKREAATTRTRKKEQGQVWLRKSKKENKRKEEIN
jgi:hypothetical protein